MIPGTHGKKPKIFDLRCCHGKPMSKFLSHALHRILCLHLWQIFEMFQKYRGDFQPMFLKGKKLIGAEPYFFSHPFPLPTSSISSSQYYYYQSTLSHLPPPTSTPTAHTGMNMVRRVWWQGIIVIVCIWMGLAGGI